MANLAQTYIHLRPFSLSRAQATVVARRLEQEVRPVIQRIYNQDVLLDVRFEEGSLKAWFSIMGVVGTLYGGIAAYKDFKEGVGELCNDAKEFGVNVCEIFTSSTKVSDSQIYRVEKRLKTPGKLRRLIEKLEKLDAASPRLSNELLMSELADVYRILTTIQSDLTAEEYRHLLGVFKFENLAPLDKIPTQVRRFPVLAIRKPEEFESLKPDLFEPNDDEAPYLLTHTSQALLLVPPPNHTEIIYHNHISIPQEDD